MTTPKCYRHADSDARSTCVECLRSVCSVCAAADDSGVHYLCPECMKKVRRKAMIKRICITGLIFLIPAIVVYFVFLHYRLMHHVKYRGEIKDLTAHLEEYPCNDRVVDMLTKAYLRVGNYRAALASAKRYFDECGFDSQLLWSTYTADGIFIVDADSNYVTLSDAFAKKLGLNNEDETPIILRTSAGLKNVRLITLNHVEVKGAKTSHVECFISDDVPDNVDGILGLSFLNHFRFDIDLYRGELRLKELSDT